MIPMGLSQRQQSTAYNFILQTNAGNTNESTYYAETEKSSAAYRNGNLKICLNKSMYVIYYTGSDVVEHANVECLLSQCQ